MGGGDGDSGVVVKVKDTQINRKRKKDRSMRGDCTARSY